MAQVNDLGIDLGTSNVLIYMKGKGIVLREPAVVAIERQSKHVLAVGSDAYKMIGRTPGNVLAVRPLRQGTSSDFELTNTMLRYFVGHVIGKRFFSRPRVVMSVPTGVNDAEKHNLIRIMLDAGAKHTQLLDRPTAAALGVGIRFEEAYGSMIVDMSAGVTDIAVLSMGEIVSASCVPLGGDYFDDAIIRYLRKKHNLLIGERTAEEIKINIGSAVPQDNMITMEVTGRSLLSGLPESIPVATNELVDALAAPLSEIMECVRGLSERTPPELSADIRQNGIFLTGGGAMLRGLDAYLSERTGLPCRLAEDPVACVAIGTGRVLENPALYSRAVYDYRRGVYDEV